MTAEHSLRNELITAVFVVINVLVDIIYSLLDPRIRHA